MAQKRGNLLHPILHVGHLVEARLRDQLAEVGVGPRQARVLSALNLMGENNQKTLAAELQIAPASMSTMCDRLIAAGLIEKRVDPKERRAFLIRLTPKGKGKVRYIRQAWDDVDKVIINAIGKEAAEAFADASSSLRDQLGGHSPKLVKNRPT